MAMMFLDYALPGSVSVYAVIPFVIIVVLCFLCSALFMRYYWNANERDRASAIIATFGLWFALMTSFLLPLDVFLISYMKDENGKFKDWATNATKLSIEDGLTYTYYALYGMILFFAFFLLPLVYFAFEAKDDENDNLSERFCSALCYTVFFVVAAGVLLLIGAFIPYQAIQPQNGTDHTTWEVLEQLIRNLSANRGIDALYFTVNMLVLIGMALFVLYTGVGMSSFPVMCVKGWRSVKAEKEILEEKKASINARKASLQSKRSLTRRQQAALSELQEEEHLLSRMETELHAVSQGSCSGLSPCFKLIDILIGLSGILLGFVIWLSLLLATIDKMIHSFGIKQAYVLAISRIPNPLDYIMVKLSGVFPLDYIFYFLIVVFLIGCTIGGIRILGIRCLCIRMFKVRPHKTEPQALIFLSVILMYIVLAMNFILFSAVPQYTTFGNQHFVNSSTHEIVPCNYKAPHDQCLLTRASSFLLGFTTKAWLFGVMYYWITWIFLLLVIVGFFWAVVKGKRSYIDEAVDRDDFEDSDSDVRPIIA